MFDLFRLRLLDELAHRGTMTAVASAFRLTSSAVSQQLATLEREAGVPLLERIGRGVRFTPEGTQLATHAREIITAVEEAAADLRGPSKRPEGTLDVACFSTYARTHLVPAIVRVQRRAPKLNVIVHEVEPADAIEAMRRGRYHVVIAFEYNVVPRARVGLRWVPLLDEPVHLVLPAGWRRNPAGTPIELARLAVESWIVGSRQTDDRLMAERACAACGFAPRITHTVDDYALLLAMVAAGLGVGLVPELGLRARAPGTVVIRRPGGQPLRRQVHAATRPTLEWSPLVRALLDELDAIGRR
jgi:DNA-binding transcriptional LysR family regulator